MLLVNTFRELTYLLVPSLCEFYHNRFDRMRKLFHYNHQEHCQLEKTRFINKSGFVESQHRILYHKKSFLEVHYCLILRD